MDNNYDLLKDVIQWDIKTWSQTLIFWEENFKIHPKMSALILGERDGGLSLWFALKNVEVTCSDIKSFSKNTFELHKKYSVNSKIKYQEGLDMTNLSQFPANHFDIISFKSVIGALSTKEQQQKAIDEMKRILKPEGAILFAENLEASLIHRIFRKTFIKWNSYWRYLNFNSDKDLFSEFQHTNLKTFGFLATFGRKEYQRNFLFGFDSTFNEIIPKSWKYVGGAVLKK
jgi:ubiquinone/menaquinone biosynthesis C-methylase UbiE